jgi:hypothetical protein
MAWGTKGINAFPTRKPAAFEKPLDAPIATITLTKMTSATSAQLSSSSPLRYNFQQSALATSSMALIKRLAQSIG